MIYPSTVTTVSVGSSNASAIVIEGSETSLSESILNCGLLLKYTPATTLMISPATNSVGNPAGSLVLESQRMTTVSVPNKAVISKFPKLS